MFVTHEKLHFLQHSARGNHHDLMNALGPFSKAEFNNHISSARET